MDNARLIAAKVGVAMVVIAIATGFTLGKAPKSVSAFTGPATPVTVADLAPRGAGVEEYTEKWAFRAALDGHWLVLVRFVVTNMGPGSNNLSFEARVVTPSGEVHRINPSYDEDEWLASSRGGRFSIKAGPNLVSGGPSKYVLHAESDALEISLKFENLLAAWRPGDGNVTFGDAEATKLRAYHIDVFSPRAKVSGKVRIGSRWFPVRGHGYADHTRTTLASFKMARAWYRFRGFTPTHTVAYLHFVTTKRYGEQEIRWLLIAEGSRVLTSDVSFSLVASDRRPDRTTTYGYRPPWKWTVSYRGSGGVRLEGSVHATEMRNTHDFLASMSLIERTIIRGFAKPVEYDQRCRFEFNLHRDASSPPIPIAGVSDDCGVMFLK